MLFRSEGIGISDIGGSIHKVLPLSAEDFSVHYDPDCGRAYIAARTDDAMTIVAFVPPDRLLGSVSLPADSEFIQVIGSTLYFADLKSLSSLSFLEE